MKIGILGGTFDPVHRGHLQLAQNARVQFVLDKVIFVPAYQPPHKKECRSITSAECRYEMVRLAQSLLRSLQSLRLAQQL